MDLREKYRKRSRDDLILSLENAKNDKRVLEKDLCKYVTDNIALKDDLYAIKHDFISTLANISDHVLRGVDLSSAEYENWQKYFDRLIAQKTEVWRVDHAD